LTHLAPDFADQAELDAAATSRNPGALFMVDRAHIVSCMVADVGASDRVTLHWGAPLLTLDAEARVAEFGGENGTKTVVSDFDLLIAADGGGSATRAALVESGALTTTELPSPVSATNYRTFHGLDDEGARALGLDTSGRGTTFALFAPPPVPAGVKGAQYAGSMAVHRRPRGNWSGLLSQSAGVYESLPAGAGPEDFAPLLDGVLGARKASFPASWRQAILAQISAPDAETGKLARLVRASALAVPAAGVALIGDAATTNTPQLGQGASSALEDGVVLAAELEKSLNRSKGGDARAAIADALTAFDAARRPARYALQDMEREIAITNRPPPVSEPEEDTEARAAWQAFFAAQRKAAARSKAVRSAIARLLPFSRRARAAAAVPDMQWWNATLHGTVSFDSIYEKVRGKRVSL
jgi:2-polyprenyl-6-methoxyphenol hydroxylase-like FAD-dependent oxidoreductase